MATKGSMNILLDVYLFPLTNKNASLLTEGIGKYTHLPA